MSRPFYVNLSGLRKQPGSRLPVEVDAPLAELKVSGSEVREDDPVHVRGVVEAMDAAEGVVVAGTVSAHWHGECRRCLGPAEGDAEVSVREIFETEPTEGETYRLRADGLDLEPLVREVVMLELPEAPLCQEDCAGLCAVCGINRNQETCACTVEVTDPRWAALDALKGV